MSGSFVIVASRFNPTVVDKLIEGCRKRLTELGVTEKNILIIRVAGAMELPLAAQHSIRSLKPKAVCALGAVVRGGTPHFDYVCQGVTQGLMTVMLENHVPVTFGVLTVDTMAQALERAGGKAGNKGEEAAEAAVEMADLLSGTASKRAVKARTHSGAGTAAGPAP
jgi:6,7-dimethyl-8-ribityllumazine synthase